MVPVVRTLQTFLPQTQISWVIGRTEAQLLSGLDGVELIVHDKRQGPLALRRQLAGRQFDLLMLMQVALRAGLAASMVKAPVRLGFDPDRSRDFHGLFINQRISADGPGHVIDGFFGFCEALGIADRVMRWDIPIPEEAENKARSLLSHDQPTLLISPCSSQRARNYRNWPIDHYVALATHAAKTHDMHAVITGGGTAVENEYGQAIQSELEKRGIASTNLVGQTDLKTLFALISRSAVVLAPDSGPVHMAVAAGTPAIGLYASSNPDRTGPVRGRQWVVNAYPQAVRKVLGREVDEIKWGRRVRDPAVMTLITPEQVIERLDQLLDVPESQRMEPVS